MKEFNIAVMHGDGIGVEIVNASLAVLDKISEKYNVRFNTKNALLGGAAIDATGVPLPEETIKTCKESDAVILGSVGGPKWDSLPGEKRPEKALLGIREALGLYANLRPAKVYEALKDACPLKDSIVNEGVDLLVVRELTGGIYFGERGRVKKEVDSAYDTESYDVNEIKRIAHVAFKSARQRRGKVTLVDKANVLESSRLWREVVNEIHKEYSDVELDFMYVDNAAMQLVRKPSQFDVILTNNIFGDILSDEASMITGSIGMLPSASVREDSFGMYEPIHGSAPDIAGKDIANPLAQILSVAMMLRYSLDMKEAAEDIERAVEEVLKDGYRTADIYAEGMKKVGTKEMGQLVVSKL